MKGGGGEGGQSRREPSAVALFVGANTEKLVVKFKMAVRGQRHNFMWVKKTQTPKVRKYIILQSHSPHY